MSARLADVEGVLDLSVVVVAVLGADLVLLWPSFPRPVRWVVGVPLLVFVPGYAFVAAAFPARPDEFEASHTSRSEPDGPPGWTVRFALAVVGSVLVVALVGVVLSATVGIRLGPALVGLSVVSLVGVAVATLRRSRLAPGRRADPLSGVSAPSLGHAGTSSRQGTTLAVAVVALAGVVVLAGLSGPPGQSYSEVSLLTENATTGDLVATGFDRTYVAGQGHSLHVAVTNQEGSERTYEVVVRAQRVENGSVVASQRVDQFELTVGDGERVVRERSIAPSLTGDRVRLQFLVYESGVPARPTRSNADLSMRLWVTVVDG